MLKELYTAAAGMLPNQTKLEVTANNMANANTAGFKREGVFIRNLLDARANLYNVPGDAESDDLPVGSYVDFSEGAYMQTGNPLDIAIESKGMFLLQDDQGDVFYSRAGQFRLTKDGSIVAKDGKFLIGEGGPIRMETEFWADALIRKDSKAVDLKISENGDVFANDHLIGSIKLIDIANPESLEKASGKYFLGTEKTIAGEIPQDEVRLRQGWIEGSNVDIISEMISMIELQRQFEAGSRVIRTNDETIQRSISLSRVY